MAYSLVCTTPFHGHKRGQVVSNEADVDRLSESHPHHFVRVFSADAPVQPALEVGGIVGNIPFSSPVLEEPAK